jgi:TfoX/Sxy family transcriptional regulator of competence genes
MAAVKRSAGETAVLISRMRRAIGRGVTEKKMFGGVCFLLRGNMVTAASSRGFLFRVGTRAGPKALARKGASPMKMRGRTLAGYIRVDPAACDARALKSWAAVARRYVSTLPPKRK